MHFSQILFSEQTIETKPTPLSDVLDAIPLKPCLINTNLCVNF